MDTFYEHRDSKLFIGEMTHYPFPTHVHEMAELVMLTAGSATVGIDGILYPLSPGDAGIIFPLVPHSYEKLSGDVRGIVAIFPPDVISEYGSTFHRLMPETPLLPAGRAGPDLRFAASRLSALNMAEDLPLCVAYLHILLAGMLHQLTYHPVYDYNEGDLGQRIMRHIADHLYEDLTLETVSHALGVSTSHLSHFFANKLKVSFRRFINANRIARARLLMRDPNLTLTEICGNCGYLSMRTFRRAFLAETGCLPSEYALSLRRKFPGAEAGAGEGASPPGPANDP